MTPWPYLVFYRNGLIKKTVISVGDDGTVDYSSVFTDTDGKLNFESAETRNATLTNVTGPVTGGWQAIQTSGSEPAKVAEGGTLAIHGNLNGNLVSNEEGSVAGVELASGSNLQLNSSGNIGTMQRCIG